MHFHFRRTYRGPLRLAIFDFAGTTVDYGCVAPAAVFVEGFRRQGVEITMAQAREPMGMEKRAHIQAIAAMEPVAKRWQDVHGRPATAEDVDALYADFVPLLLDVLESHSALIPGAADVVGELRKAGLRIAGTTGYFSQALNVVVQAAARQGYAPDYATCATEVPAGRPAPWMIYQSMRELGIYPPEAVVKIGDTRPDIEAGLNAGVWTVGLAQTGNEVGLDQAEIQALPAAELASRLETARTRLAGAGAHFVVDGIWDLPPVLDEIRARMQAGERP